MSEPNLPQRACGQLPSLVTLNDRYGYLSVGSAAPPAPESAA